MWLSSIRQARSTSGGVGNLLSNRVRFGAEHPLANAPTEASINAITLDDCKAHVAQLQLDTANVVAVGDIDSAGFTALWKKATAAHPHKQVNVVPPRLSETLVVPRVVFVAVPGSAQSSITVLGNGPARTDKNDVDNKLAVSVFGGGFSSRLNMNLREKNGYTYGAGASLYQQPSVTSLVGSTSVRNDATVAALTEIFSEWNLYKKGGAMAEEVARERDGAIAAFPARFETIAGTAGTWGQQLRFGLPFQEMLDRRTALETATTTSVTSAGKRVTSTPLAVLVVGDPSVLPSLIEALRSQKIPVGQLEVWDAFGHVRTATCLQQRCTF
jgi:zinc protease